MLPNHPVVLAALAKLLACRSLLTLRNFRIGCSEGETGDLADSRLHCQRIGVRMRKPEDLSPPYSLENTLRYPPLELISRRILALAAQVLRRLMIQCPPVCAPVFGSIAQQNKDFNHLQVNGAQERTRTFTAVKPLAPEASASTNSATWALGAVTTDRSRGCQIGGRGAKYTTVRDMTARCESAKEPRESLEFG
jgi:hypothetical protein